MPIPQEIGALHEKYLASNSPRGPKKKMPIETFARILELAKTNQHAAQEIRAQLNGRVGTYKITEVAAHGGIKLPDKNVAVRQRLQRAYFYLRRIAEKTERVAAKDVGIATTTANRWEPQILSRYERRQMKHRNFSRGVASPHRGKLRWLLGRTNPNGSYKYSLRVIASAAEIDTSAVQSANGAHPSIRSKEELRIEGIRFRRMTRSQYRQLLDEAKTEFTRISKINNDHVNHMPLKNILNLTESEKVILERKLMDQIDSIPNNRSNMQASEANVKNAKAILLGVFRSPQFYIATKELVQKLGSDYQKMRKGLNLIDETSGIGIIKNINGILAIHPQATIYLNGNLNGSRPIAGNGIS